MVSLWDMLSVISVAAALGGGLGGALSAGGGIGRYVLGAFLGLGSGVLSTAAIRKGGAHVFRSLSPENVSEKTPARLSITYLAAVVWAMGLGPLVSWWIADRIIRAVFP